ncbi:hypothetical protein BGZ95_005362 [Linnemannia exigua]|uniref:F-box domain-containing protein n=1 Tax=Linnemannia exigua TaxID=604196 RepID=A0AAD4DGS2_9FUNG|nr:hypothetical protein BGZ95_005362 [Linnemannia exigua]
MHNSSTSSLLAMHSRHQHHQPQQHHVALDVPEILHIIGEYLSRRDIITCFRVCASFHSSLAPFLYRDLDLIGGASRIKYSCNKYTYGHGYAYNHGDSCDNNTLGLAGNGDDDGESNNKGADKRWQTGRRRVDGGRMGQRPTLAVLRDRYAPLVRRVKLETRFTSEYLTVGFTHLTAITISYNGDALRKPEEATIATTSASATLGAETGCKRKKMKTPSGEGTDTKEDDANDNEVEQNGKGSFVDNTKALVRLVQDNKELVSWTFEKFRTSPLSAEVWKAIVEAAQERLEAKNIMRGGRRMSPTTVTASTGLELLEVKQMTVDKESAPWFVKACRLAKVLKLVVVDLTHASLLHHHDPVPPISSPSPLSQHRPQEEQEATALIPPMAHEINMWSLQGFTFMDQLRFLVECSQARSIAWSSPCAQWRHDLFHLSNQDLETLINPGQEQRQRQQRPQWPHIHSLRFSEWLRGKIDLTEMAGLGTSISRLLLHIIPSNNQIRFFRLSGAKMQPMAVDTIQQHHNLSLNHIRLRSCPSVTSTMIQGLLESCPNLTTLTANVLSVDAISRGRPWVCRDLVEFQVYLDLCHETQVSVDKALESQHLVYTRLATLPNLERLLIARIPGRSNNMRPETLHSLNLRLACGLGSLSTLKRLKVLNFVDVEQWLDKESVEWMIASWPKLNSVQGMLTPSLEQSSALATILTNHGIFHSCA